MQKQGLISEMSEKNKETHNAAHVEKSSNLNWMIVFICWIIACVSLLGSLFFSEIMDYAPCSMCWYQRVFMYPLVVLFLTGLFPFDRNIVKYTLPLSLLGCAFALYHTLLYSGYIPKNMQPCSQGVSCTETYLDVFGFITIPLLSLMAFSTIAGLLLVLRRRLST